MAEPNQLMKRQSRGPVAQAKAEPKTQFLAFGLGGENYATEIRFVKEVIQFGELLSVPLMPEFIRGVINLRGAVVPVIDLAVRFRRPPTDVARRTCIVILEVPLRERSVVLGIIVDNVSEVLELAAADLEPAPSFGQDDRSGFIKGMGKVAGGFVVLLDVNQVLSVAEISSLAEVRGSVEAPS